jgi:hypothetical protein
MDTWTDEALALRNDIRGVEASLTTRIDDTAQRLTTRIDDTEQRLTARIDETAKELTARIDDVAQQLRGEMVDTRRHSDVLFESLRDDIRLVAEGLAAVSAKVDRLTR